MKALKELKSWMTLHPLLTAGFSAGFGVLATIIGFRQDWWQAKLAAAILLLLWVWHAIVSKKAGTKVVTALLILSWFIGPMDVKAAPPPAQQDFQPAGMVGVGVVVIVGGVVVVVMIIRFCNRKLPRSPAPNTNPPPAIGFAARAADEVAAASYYGACYDTPSGATATTLASAGQVNGNTLTMTARASTEWTQTFEELQADLAERGVTLTPGRPSEFHAVGGVPITATNSSVQFNLAQKVATVGTNATRRVRIDISRDAKTWEHVLDVDIPDGREVQVLDTTYDGKGFHRMTLLDPQ